MPHGLVVPSVRHVWVHSHGRYTYPAPGVVAGWHQQLGTEPSQGLALVAVQRATANVAIEWVPVDLLDPITDATPGTWTSRGRSDIRHVWRGPLYDGGPPAPAILVDKRRANDGWQVQLAIVNTRAGSVLVDWQPARTVRPVTDDAATSPTRPNSPGEGHG